MTCAIVDPRGKRSWIDFPRFCSSTIPPQLSPRTIWDLFAPAAWLALIATSIILSIAKSQLYCHHHRTYWREPQANVKSTFQSTSLTVLSQLETIEIDFATREFDFLGSLSLFFCLTRKRNDISIPYILRYVFFCVCLPENICKRYNARNINSCV